MSARGTVLQIIGKGAMLCGAILLVTILLAAMPGHHAPAQDPAIPQPTQQPPPAQSSPSKAKDMPSMDMDDAKSNEKAAVQDMTPGHHDAHGHHMFMTTMRRETPEDTQRAKEIVTQLRAGIEKYKDYHVALNDGFKIFLPNLPQKEYHFTSYRNGFLEGFTFNPARPTSLLYKKTATGYDLVGAMYTMPKHASEDQLNARVPLSVAMWHLHTNLCMPPRDRLKTADWTKFGLAGSLDTEDACSEAGGKFHPVIFGWMVHVYPYEDSNEKVFAMHMHNDEQ